MTSNFERRLRLVEGKAPPASPFDPTGEDGGLLVIARDDETDEEALARARTELPPDHKRPAMRIPDVIIRFCR